MVLADAAQDGLDGVGVQGTGARSNFGGSCPSFDVVVVEAVDGAGVAVDLATVAEDGQAHLHGPDSGGGVDYGYGGAVLDGLLEAG